MKYQALLDYQTKEIEKIKFKDAVKQDKSLNLYYRSKTIVESDENNKKLLEEKNTCHSNFLGEIEKDLIKHQKNYDELVKKTLNTDSIEKLKVCLDEIINEKDSIIKIFEQIKKNEEIISKLTSSILSADKLKTYEEYIKKNDDQITQLSKKVKEKMKQLDDEIVALRKKVPQQHLDIYDRKKVEAQNNNKNTGMIVAVVKYDCAHCKHCSLEISPDVKNKLKQGDLVECESCHMLLVMEENK